MKNFNFNLLQYLNNKKAEKGFTLIELLVVIIIIGILSAIALPAFLNQASKARQSEAKQSVGALNRGQQAYYLEGQAFAFGVSTLGLGLPTVTKNYAYEGVINSTYTPTTPPTAPTTAYAAFGTGVGQFAAGTAPTSVTMFANPLDPKSTKTYQGMTFLSADPDGNATTSTVLCESTKPMGQSGSAPGASGAASGVGACTGTKL